MAEYIDKNDATKRIASIATIAKSDSQKALIGRALYCIDHIPAADVAPVRHGRWVNSNEDPLCITVKCSLCNEEYPIWAKKDFNYCPNCGAKMIWRDDNAVD